MRTHPELGPDAFVFALKTVFDAERAGEFNARVELWPGDDRFAVDITDGSIEIGRGSFDEPVCHVVSRPTPPRRRTD